MAGKGVEPAVGLQRPVVDVQAADEAGEGARRRRCRSGHRRRRRRHWSGSRGSRRRFPLGEPRRVRRRRRRVEDRGRRRGVGRQRGRPRLQG